MIDSLPTLQQKLFEANNNQEMFKKERGKVTRERVEKINILYDHLKTISDIARIIYADNPAQLEKYLFPTPKSSTNSSDDLLTS